MSLTLCMVVKNEINTIEACLDPIVAYIDELIIIDNMSTDGTYELLQERYNITPKRGVLSKERCLNKADLRNVVFQNVKTDWILSMDADERILPESLKLFRNKQHDANVSGYFGLWENYVNGSEPFEDYKLFLFRKGLKKRGFIHENVQKYIREKGLTAEWLNGFGVKHYPEKAKHNTKSELYKQRLHCAIKKDPDWVRYYWFLGYMYFQEGNWNEAIKYLEQVLKKNADLMPVEFLNSTIILATIFAKNNNQDKTIYILQQGLQFYNAHKHDFEVIVNKRIEPWLLNSLNAVKQNKLDQIVAYRFAR